ncbi:zinc-binding protein A33-like [Acipenser ruthenus]|uniref:zinc-binding protein A33-like n=1 Tax=Acipenser ruthenus TaxID=7906 RepID=UPI002742708B|nr:zinc-binding protein A33-like [Acipenser ruthenus]
MLFTSCLSAQVELFIMAAAASGETGELQKELTCAICLDFFDDPVILQCGHNFCRDCILIHWQENGSNGQGYKCPECRRSFPSMSFTKNYLVRNLVDKLDDLEYFKPKQTKAAVPQPKEEGRCEKHREELKLFCKTDNKLICVICRESRAHKHHEVAPLPEVIEDLKDDLRCRLTNLNDDKICCTKVKNEDVETRLNIQMKKLQLKESIEASVGQLIQFLLDEKDELLEKLDSEEQTALSIVENNIQRLENLITEMEKEITEIQGNLSQPSFEVMQKIVSRPLQDLSHLHPSTSEPNWEDFSGPVQIMLWKRMLSVLRPAPENLVLDQDTAHPNLIISEYNTTMEESRGRVLEPDLPQKFTRFLGVLATTEYTSGKHYWEVDVKGKGVWYLGLTDIDSNRKGYVNLSPYDGYWSICLQDEMYANDEQRVFIKQDWSISRVGMFLDYDAGLLSFYDAILMKHLYTFRQYFDGPVCPFFSPGKNDIGSRMKICHYH